MQKITLFHFAACPHCQKAKEFMKQVVEAHPEYGQIPVETIDERLHPDIADRYDYFDVPTFYVGGEKLHEGVPSYAQIAAVYQAAYTRD